MGEIRFRSGQNASINNDCIYGRRTQAVTVNNTMIHITQTYEVGGMVRRSGIAYGYCCIWQGFVKDWVTPLRQVW